MSCTSCWGVHWDVARVAVRQKQKYVVQMYRIMVVQIGEEVEVNSEEKKGSWIERREERPVGGLFRPNTSDGYGKSSCWPWQHPGESPTYILHKDKT